MKGPRFAGRLLSNPGFADDSEYRLAEAARTQAELHAAIDAAAERMAAGEPPKQAAFELIAEHPAMQTIAIFAEVGEGDRAYLHAALDTPEEVRAAADGLVARLDALPALQAGIGEAMPSLKEVRWIGPPFEVDVASFTQALATDGVSDAVALLPGDLWIELPAKPGESQSALWDVVEWSLVEATLVVLDAHGCLPLEPFDHPPRIEAGLEADLLVQPRRARLLHGIMDLLVDGLEAGGRSRAAARAIVQALPAFFERGLLTFAHDDTLDALRSDDAVVPADRRAAQYGAELRASIWRPVLGQPFALPQIYVPPRGRVSLPSAGRQRPGPADRGQPAIVDVQRALDAWLATDDPADVIRVVSGAPGAGKSSLARMYAAARSRKPGTTWYVPLHSFDLGGDFRDAIRAEWPGLDPFAPERGPLLLILDGLDEFALRGPEAAGSVGQLVDAVCRTAELLNQGNIAMRVLLLGRELVVQRISDRFRKPGQVIHLLPLRIDEGAEKNAADPDGLRDVDLRHAWWRRYGAVTGEALEGVPPELDMPAFDALTREPLLNMLLAIARKDGLLPQDRADLHRGELYQRLIRQVFERVHAVDGPQRVPGVEAVDFADYERFLWTIAEAAWHGAGRTASVDDIRRIANPRLLERLDVLTKGAEDPVSRLMTAFYFREHRGAAAEQKTFEFTHQSFAEYLLACRIIDFLDLLDEERARYDRGRGGWSADEAALKWYGLFGPAALEDNVLDFLGEAVRQRGAEVARRWQARVAAIMRGVIVDGFPIERAERRPFSDECRWSCRAGCALLMLASVCARVSRARTNLEEISGVESWLASLLQPRFAVGALARRVRGFLDWLALRHLPLTLPDTSDSRFDHGRFDSSFLAAPEVRLASFAHCSLRNVAFPGGRWMFVDLTGADLTGARLEGTGWSTSMGSAQVPSSFHGVRFHGAILTSAILVDATFHDCTADTRTVWPEGFDPEAAGIVIEPD